MVAFFFSISCTSGVRKGVSRVFHFFARVFQNLRGVSFVLLYLSLYIEENCRDSCHGIFLFQSTECKHSGIWKRKDGACNARVILRVWKHTAPWRCREYPAREYYRRCLSQHTHPTKSNQSSYRTVEVRCSPPPHKIKIHQCTWWFFIYRVKPSFIGGTKSCCSLTCLSRIGYCFLNGSVTSNTVICSISLSSFN